MFGTGKQGLVIAFSQMLEVVNSEVNPETGEREKVNDTGYMIHITPLDYTDGCTGIPYDPNDPESKAKALINKLVDIFEQTMSEKGDKNATITIMD